MLDADCLVFRMNGADSASNAARLADTLVAAGHRPAIVPFWAEFIDHEGQGRHFEMPLLPTGIGSAPRLSGFAFARVFGRDLDLFDLSAHTYASGEVRAETLLLESGWNQHMRGIGLTVDRLLALMQPAFVYVPHGAEIVSRIIAEMAARRGCKVLYWESPFFPGFHYVDPAAPHFFRGASWIDRRWPDHAAAPLAETRRAAAQKFVAEWRGGRVSKYGQASDPAELAALDAWLSRGRGAVLFVPGQIAYDANVTISLGTYPDLPSIYARLVRQLPAGWRIVFKHHPKGPELSLPEIDGGRLFHAHRIAIHDIFQRVALVGTHSSNVGLEAILWDTPVICWGTPVYGGKGLTADVRDVAEVPALLRGGTVELPAWERVLAFIDLLIGECLVPEGDGARLAGLMAHAGSTLPPPRLGWYGTIANRMAEAGRALHEALRANDGISAALQALPKPLRTDLLARVPEEAFAKHPKGGPVSTTRNSEPPLDLEPLAALFPGAHATSSDEINDCIDPADAVAALLRAAGPDGTVLLTAPNAPREPGEAVQRILPSDIAVMVEAAGHAATVDLFGIDRMRLFDSHANCSRFLAIVRPAARGPLSPTERAAVLAMPLRTRTHRLPALSFQYREPAEPKGDALLIRPDGRAGHMIFGPYVALPPGRWTATFRFDHGKPRDKFHKAGLVVEVNGPGEGVKAKRRYGPQDDLAGMPPVLEFVARPNVTYEFRIFADGVLAQAPMTFHGVDLDYLGPAH